MALGIRLRALPYIVAVLLTWRGCAHSSERDPVPARRAKALCLSALNSALAIESSFQRQWSKYIAGSDRSRYAHYLFPAGYVQALQRLRNALAYDPHRESVAKPGFEGEEPANLQLTRQNRKSKWIATLGTQAFEEFLESLAGWRHPEPPQRSPESSAQDHGNLASSMRRIGLTRLGFRLPGHNWAHWLTNALDRPETPVALRNATKPFSLSLFFANSPAPYEPRDSIVFLLRDEVLNRRTNYQFVLATSGGTNATLVDMSRFLSDLKHQPGSWIILGDTGIVTPDDIVAIWCGPGARQNLPSELAKLPPDLRTRLADVNIVDLENSPYLISPDGTPVPLGPGH